MLDFIIPSPKSLCTAEGTIAVPAVAKSEYDSFARYLPTLADAVERLFDEAVTVGENGIVLRHDATIANRAYTLDSTGEQIVLSASDEEGIAYAVASLLQMMSVKDGQVTMHRVQIADAPDKEYRALMIDLASEWNPLKAVLRYIDLCFFYKVRYLHIHFIDNESYTLPSRAFPKLNEGHRFYSHEDVAVMCEYAKARGVILIPEFEVPGHAIKIVTAYPEIFGNKMMTEEGTSITTETGAVMDAQSIVCAGSSVTYEAMTTLLDEICELFPDTPYIHIGGDEANIKAWNFCSECVRYMKEHSIEDEYELYSEFVGRIASLVLKRGKTPIVWEGFPRKGSHRIPKETIVIAWESHYNMAYDLLADGFKIINGSWQPLYIVDSMRHRWSPREIMAWDVYNWQHWWEHSEATLNPIHVTPTEDVLGAQLSIWGGVYEQNISRAMENLPTVSERTWNVRRLLDDTTYESRLKKMIRHFSHLIQER